MEIVEILRAKRAKNLYPPHPTINLAIFMFKPQTTQTAYLLSQGGLGRPIVDPARHATFLR